MPTLPAESNDVAVYTPENMQRLISVLWNSHEEPKTASVLFYVALGAFAGLRPAEAVALEWKHIDTDKRQISVPSATGQIARVVPIKDNLLELLLPFKSYRNGLVVMHKKVANLLRNECAQAGVGHISNGLRRSFAAYRLVESSEAVALKELGLTTVPQEGWPKVSTDAASRYWAVRP